MSQCDDAFQQIQALQQEKAKAEAEAAELKRLLNIHENMPDQVVGSDRGIRQAADNFLSQVDGETSKRWVEAAMGNRARTDISDGGGQPNNFDQMLRQMDVRTVQDYAALSKELLDTGSALKPEAYRFIDDKYGKEQVAQLVMDSYAELVGSDKLAKLLAGDVAPFTNLVERMTRLRVAAWGFRKGLLEDMRMLEAAKRAGTGPVSGELKQQFFDSLKKALVSERHVDLARSRTGQTLRSLQEDLPDLEALRTELETGRAFDPDGDEGLAGDLTLKPGDAEAGSLFAEVAGALDDTNAQRGADKLKQLVLVTEMEGANPKSRLRQKDWFNSQMKLGNLLAKDSQLTNETTQLIANGGSNAVMMLVGPARQAFENVGVLTPYGTKFSREAWQQGFAANWAGVKQALDVVRSSGAEVWSDAFFQGRSLFAGNKDTFGKNLHANDQLALQMQQLIDQPYMGGWMANPINWGIQRNKIHASIRLWLYEKTGQAWLMEPGLRMLAAVDNVAGLYHHAFKVRNDLEVRVRKEGAQLGLFDQKSIDSWIDTEFNKAFYSLAPTEDQVKAYRRELGLKGDISDDDIKAELLNKKIGETYGAPTLGTQESINAEQYSREMRFQNEPGDLRPESHRGQFASAAYEGVQTARKNWLVDLEFPYLQSPLMGTLMDMNHLGVTPAIDSLSMAMHPAGFTPAQKARVKANWVVAGTILGSFFILDAMGLIEGNGPIEPQEREEWLTALKARKGTPNSIAGVPLLGGVPVINTLFLLKDIKENFITGTYSKYDQNKALMAGMQVLAGQLMRQTGLGQFRQLMEMFQTKGDMLKGTLEYMGGGQVPGIGIMRSLARNAAVTRQDLYQSAPSTALEQQAGVGDDFIQQRLEELRQLAYGTIPLTAAIGGVRKETDWLGSKINLPWGMRYVEALKDRFTPQLWPKDKVYAELDAQNMLNPPAALMTRELDGVAMSDQLQKEYNDAYGTVRGESLPARLAIAKKKPSVTVSLPQRIDLPSGATYNATTKLVSIDLAPFLAEHVKGKTAIEAFRSVINSPLYQRMQALPGTTSNLQVRDMTPAQRRGSAAQALLQTVKDYYGLLAHDHLVRSNSPEAREWRDRRSAVFAERQAQAGQELRDLVEAVNGPQ